MAAAALPSSCIFGSPALPAKVGGAQPSFGFFSNNTNYFGIPASFTQYGTVCYNDNEPSGATSFAPLIVSSTFTQTCQFAGGVNSLYCPELHDSAFPTGTHTLSYNAAPGFVPFIPTTFIIANGVQQATTYVTVVSTSTAPAVAAGTVTVVVPSLTTTSTQNVAVTQTSTVQQTAVITSCYTTPTPQTTTTCSPLLPATTGVSCPGSGGQTYKGFVIECYNDRYNSDLKNSPASSLSDCINQCINTNGCVDVSFVPGSLGVCYMKNNIGAPQTNYGVWAARNWYAISTSSASPSPTALSCPQNNGQLVYQNSGKVFQVECYIDREDNDMTNVSPVTVSNLNQCIAACDGTRRCVDVSLSGVACYLKNGIGAPRNNSVVFGSRLLSYPSNGVQVSDGASASTSASATKIMKRSTTTAVIVTTASPQALVAGGPVIAPAPAFLQSWCTWCSGWAGPDTTYGWLPTTTITTTQSTTITPPATTTYTQTTTRGSVVKPVYITSTTVVTTTVLYTSTTCPPPQTLTLTYTNKVTTTQIWSAQGGIGGFLGALGGRSGSRSEYLVTNTYVSTSTIA